MPKAGMRKRSAADGAVFGMTNVEIRMTKECPKPE